MQIFTSRGLCFYRQIMVNERITCANIQISRRNFLGLYKCQFRPNILKPRFTHRTSGSDYKENFLKFSLNSKVTRGLIWFVKILFKDRIFSNTYFIKQDIPMYFPIMHILANMWGHINLIYIHTSLPSISLNARYYGSYFHYVSLKKTLPI